MSDLLTRLRQLARAEHDDLDVVDEALEEIINLRTDVHVLREMLERCKHDSALQSQGKYSFDDMGIGIISVDGRSLKTQNIPRPPGLTNNSEWYDCAKAICSLLNGVNNDALQSKNQEDDTPLGKALDGINSYFASKKAVEPVVADAPVPNDKSTRKWKRIEEYSREMDGKKIDIYLGDFLLYCPQLEDEENSGVVIGYYSEPYKGWYASETLEEVFPTHFMSLPEKPL